jgi:hypothetical protein
LYDTRTVATSAFEYIHVKDLPSEAVSSSGSQLAFEPGGPYADTASVVAMGSNGQLYTTWQSVTGGNWHGWSAIGGAFPGGSEIGSPQLAFEPGGPYADTASVVAMGSNGQLYTTWQSVTGGNWHGWSAIGGAFLGGV